MSQIVTVAKIGKGVDGNEYRPNTTAIKWREIDTTATTMTIEILD